MLANLGKYTFLVPFIRVGITAIIGIPFFWILSNFIKNQLQKHVTKHISILVSKIIFYAGLALLTTLMLGNLGFNLTALLGAAGVLGIAIGFAAQTSFSNIISGIFLLLERSFIVGDIITYNAITGTVESINLFSVCLKTFDGKLVRIPNESILKTATINTTYFETRRIDLKMHISKREDPEQAFEIARSIVAHNTVIKKYPAPLFAITSTSYFSTVISIRIWVPKKDFAATARTLVGSIAQESAAKKIMLSIEHSN
jgi:small-conductance mechanosensitive channel